MVSEADGSPGLYVARGQRLGHWFAIQLANDAVIVRGHHGDESKLELEHATIGIGKWAPRRGAVLWLGSEQPILIGARNVYYGYETRRPVTEVDATLQLEELRDLVDQIQARWRRVHLPPSSYRARARAGAEVRQEFVVHGREWHAAVVSVGLLVTFGCWWALPFDVLLAGPWIAALVAGGVASAGALELYRWLAPRLGRRRLVVSRDVVELHSKTQVSWQVRRSAVRFEVEEQHGLIRIDLGGKLPLTVAASSRFRPAATLGQVLFLDRAELSQLREALEQSDPNLLPSLTAGKE